MIKLSLNSSSLRFFAPIKMLLSLATTAIILLAHETSFTEASSLSRVVPKAAVDISHAYRHTGYIDQRVRGDPHAILNHQLYHLRNVVRSPAAPAPSPPEQKAVTPAPNDATTTMQNPAPACLKALTALNGSASNPSGMAVCYNVMQMDNTTGVFMADVRLYRIAAPTGDWATLDMKKVSTGLTYLGANVSNPLPSTTKRDELQLSDDAIDEIAKREAAPPQSVQNSTFIGKAHPDVLPYLNNA